MLSSKALPRLVLLGIFVGTAAIVTGCTSFKPVYGDAAAVQGSLNLAYAKPNSRLEQLVYQELRLRLGSSDSTTAPLASVTISAGAADLVLSQTANPNKAKEMTATATLTITPRDGSGAPVQTYTRRAVANYTTSGQVLADKSAENDAAERATKAAAESLRLAVLAGLSR